MNVPTRYPNALPGSVPFEVFGQEQAETAVAGAGRPSNWSETTSGKAGPASSERGHAVLDTVLLALL